MISRGWAARCSAPNNVTVEPLDAARINEARQHSSDEEFKDPFEVSITISGNSSGDFPDLAWSDQGDGLANRPRAEANIWPGSGAQDYDSDLSPRQVLLVPKVLISRDEHLVAFTFR